MHPMLMLFALILVLSCDGQLEEWSSLRRRGDGYEIKLKVSLPDRHGEERLYIEQEFEMPEL